MTGEAESCKSICHGVGWPSPAHAAPAFANTLPALAAIAAKRDNAFIPRPAPLLLIVSQPPPQPREPPRYDATGLAGLVPRRDVPGGLRRDKGISGSSKIGDCCNALMIAAAAAPDNPDRLSIARLGTRLGTHLGALLGKARKASIDLRPATMA
jgi:hypothetical protein